MARFLRGCLMAVSIVFALVAVTIASYSYRVGCNLSALMRDVCDGPLPWRTSKSVMVNATFIKHLPLGAPIDDALARLRDEGFAVQAVKDLDVPLKFRQHYAPDYWGRREMWISSMPFGITVSLIERDGKVVSVWASVWQAITAP